MFYEGPDPVSQLKEFPPTPGTIRGDFCTPKAPLFQILNYPKKKYGIEMDRSKIEAISNWPTPSSIHDVRSFHGLVSLFIGDLFMDLAL